MALRIRDVEKAVELSGRDVQLKIIGPRNSILRTYRNVPRKNVCYIIIGFPDRKFPSGARCGKIIYPEEFKTIAELEREIRESFDDLWDKSSY